MTYCEHDELICDSCGIAVARAGLSLDQVRTALEAEIDDWIDDVLQRLTPLTPEEDAA